MTQYHAPNLGPFRGVRASAFHVYVSGLNGTNAAGYGLRPEAPLATIDEALRRYVPDIINQDVVIHVGAPDPAAPYTLSQLARARTYQGNLVIIGDGAGQPGEDGFTVVNSGTVTQGASRVTFDVSSSLGASDTFVGYTVEFTTGDNAGARRLIRDHDSTEVNVTLGYLVDTQIGDAYRVVAPAATTASLAGQYLRGAPITGRNFANLNSGRLYLINLTLGTTGNCFFTGNVVFYGCRLNSVQLRDAYVSAGGDTGSQDTQTITNADATYVTDLFGLADPELWIGWGLFMAGGTATLDNVVGRLVALCVVGRVSCLQGASVLLLTGRVLASLASFAGVQAASRSFVGIGAFFSGTISGANQDFLVTHSGTTAASHGVDVVQGGYAQLLTLRTELASTLSAGLHARYPNSVLELGSGSAFPVVAGGAYGCHVELQGRATVNQAGSGIADGSTPPATANYAAGSAPATRASFAAVGNALVGSSNDSPPEHDGSTISRVS